MKSYLLALKHTLASHRYAAGGAIAFLVIQNLVIFWQHYLGKASFHNDFISIYYPMTAFWTTLVRHGIFPEWLPFENMGFPFVLTMQSGVFYPPLWLFAFSEHLLYTLHAAIIFQALHVLLGAIGCWCYARLLGRTHSAALFAAIAFQFFGGFYSNSEHVDIIRAFAYIPWLFWAVQWLPTQKTINGRNLCAPLIVWLFVTGAYQANVISHFFLLGIFMLLSFCAGVIQQKNNRALVAKIHLQAVGLVLLGITLSSVCLLPTLALKSSLLRGDVWTGKTMSWYLGFWDSLIMPSTTEGVYVTPSMVSAFITVPAFCLLFLVSRRLLKEHAAWVGVIVIAFLMASGVSNVIRASLIAALPPLGYSRFPSSDYRAVMAFGLIILASGILEDYQLRKINWRWAPVLVCVTWSVLMFISANYITADSFEWLFAAVLATAVFATLGVFGKQRGTAVLVLLVLELISGIYFLERMSFLWRSDLMADAFYQEVDHEPSNSIVEAVRHPVAIRPACADLNFYRDSWKGYLSGAYICESHDSKTAPREIVNANPFIDNYMRQAWNARLITREQLATCQPEAVLQGSTETFVPIHSTFYGLQEIRYQVKAAGNFCFVENETQFAGWSGKIEGVTQPIPAQVYCGALRSWCLPGGEYQFIALYRTPWLREGVLVSLAALFIYLILFWYWRKGLTTTKTAQP